MNRALALQAQAPTRADALADAEATLSAALDQAPQHAAILRDLARVRSARYDDAGALEALRHATQSPRLDAFDMLQIAHVYRDAGFAAEAYTWAARAYDAWGRPPEDAVMRVYAENTLVDNEGGHRARTLATQAEAAMRARSFGLAADLFQQALVFVPDNAYLQDRLGAAQRAVVRYGPGPSAERGGVPVVTDHVEHRVAELVAFDIRRLQIGPADERFIGHAPVAGFV
jgi:tetratricopeptide (TPR) repeat protein